MLLDPAEPIGFVEDYPVVLDPGLPEVRIDFGMAEAEHASRTISAATAAQWAVIHTVLEEARAFPTVFVGPTADPSNRSDVEFAVRAAVADLAVRLSVAENTIRTQEFHARIMLARTPRVWQLFRAGEVSAANARVVADLAGSLPEGNPDLYAAFDEAVADLATRLAPARFVTRARVISQKLHTEQAVERHRRRLEERRVWVDADLDGMAWFSAYLPAEVAVKALAGLDATAIRLAASADETRTFHQIRADILADLITGTSTGTVTGTDGGKTPKSPVGVRVGIMVPVMTLLGLDDQPASLEGYGPIDADTARRLTAQAPTFYRILTHPITGTILDIDKTTLRIPADMRRWLEHRDQTCTHPGCGHPARHCDLDHTVDRQYGGTTKISNLAHLCRKHHRNKHKTRWTTRQHPDGTIQWTSPTGHTTTSDPPPY